MGLLSRPLFVGEGLGERSLRRRSWKQEAGKQWEALLVGLNPDRSAREILFDPLVEDWAFAGLSEGYQEAIREKQHSDRERAILLDRLRWVAQKRLSGRLRESMLLYLAGCSQVEIAGLLRASRSIVSRDLVIAGERLKAIIGSTQVLSEGTRFRATQVKILPLDSEDDFKEFVRFTEENEIDHVALGTSADLREALVIYGEG